MKKNQTILFDIPLPCHEDWDKMSKQEKGRHCALCNKVVVDFTNMNDDEVLNHFKLSTSKICGRIRNEQLEQTPRLQYVEYARLFLYAFAVIFFMGISEVGEAQVKAQSADSLQVSNRNSIKGRVLDEKGEPLLGATIRVFCDGKSIGGVVSDKNGQFKIYGLKSGNYYITVTSIGYDLQESKPFDLKGREGRELKVNMTRGHFKMKGAMVIRVSNNKLIDPSNPGRKIINREQIKHSAY